MLFKSVRSSSRSWINHSIPIGAIFAGSLLLATPSFALTVTPVSVDNIGLTNVEISTAFYPTTGTGVDLGDSSVPRPVTTASQGSDPGGANALRFNITGSSTSYTPPAGVSATYATYIMAFVQSTINTSDAYAVPIAYYNTNPGGGGVNQTCTNNCFLTGTVGSNTYYFAAPYTPGSTAQIAIYPSDICFLYAGIQLNNSGVGAPCSGNAGSTGLFNLPAATDTTGFTLKFYIAQIPTSTLTTINPQSQTYSNLNGTSTSQIAFTADALNLVLSFQGKGGSLPTCPDQITANLYFPGDRSIYFDTTQFQLRFVGPTVTSGRTAAVNSILMTHRTSPSSVTIPPVPGLPVLTNAGFPADPVLARNIQLGNSSELVYGFTNSTSSPAVDVFYNLAIFMRDSAGFVTTTACPLDNVRTAEVQGFLKASKCFIATAAYRSKDAAPVVMLRQFRDDVLLQFGAGRGFVEWYYRWSPPAAEWLMDHPGFRYPVLLALVPVEIFAWLCLRPLIVLLLAGGSIVLFLLMKNRASEARGESL